MDEPRRHEEYRRLLVEWAGGARSAGDALLERLLPGIYGLCLRILKRDEDAEDAAQETFLRLCSAVRNGEEFRDVRKWAATVAMNLSFNIRHKRMREIPAELDIGDDLEPEPIDSTTMETIRRRIDELPERYRLALHQRFALDMKPAEIAENMDLEPGAARVLLHRALKALRKMVKE